MSVRWNMIVRPFTNCCQAAYRQPGRAFLRRKTDEGLHSNEAEEDADDVGEGLESALQES